MKFIAYQGASVWNDLPVQIKEVDEYANFRQLLRNSLISFRIYDFSKDVNYLFRKYDFSLDKVTFPKRITFFSSRI